MCIFYAMSHKENVVITYCAILEEFRVIFDIECGEYTVVFTYLGERYYFCNEQFVINIWYPKGFFLDSVSLKYVLLHFPNFALTFQDKFGILPTDRENI